jgi:hypothetical protein
MKQLVGLGFAACIATSAPVAAATESDLSLIGKSTQLKSGQYLWQPNAAATGPVLLTIDLSAQLAIVYRDGVPIGASTVSTGRVGRETPSGAFSILQKEIVHRSRTYDDAPMPYMQRLTWKGVAMHAGHLPGYPASHGCIRLPARFARLLYAVTKVGTRVLISDRSISRSALIEAGELDRTAPDPQ